MNTSHSMARKLQSNRAAGALKKIKDSTAGALRMA
jgi:hypothetical protein